MMILQPKWGGRHCRKFLGLMHKATQVTKFDMVIQLGRRSFKDVPCHQSSGRRIGQIFYSMNAIAHNCITVSHQAVHRCQVPCSENTADSTMHYLE